MLKKSLLITVLVFGVTPSTAHAEPVSAFITILASGAGFATAGAAFVAAGGWAAIGAFLLSPFGSLLLSIGLQLVTSLFIKKPDAPSIEASKVNVKIPEPERWLAGGRTRQGGGVVFAEFDTAGNFWYVIVHADTILTSTVKLYFDDTEIVLDVNNYVETNEFCLTDGGEAYSGSGAKVKYYQVFTTTHTADNPTPPAISELETAFPGVWTSDHKLVGTTYSAVKIKPIKPENRYKVLKWRGPVGIGEPSFSIVGNWSVAYNPNDVAQIKGDVSSYSFTRNSVLLWAWYRTHRYGRNKSNDTINWEKVAEHALICDIVKTDIDGNSAPQYQCDIAVAESAERTVGEQQILMSCDAQLVFDDDGKCWPRVGHYYSPELNLYRNRDIVAMESVEAQNGESLTQGVIVRYMDPDADYSGQPCAPYVNPFYYVEGETAKYLVVDILTIQNHRQAMQLAKSISHRSQPEHKLLPTTGLRGLRARQERIVGLQYDNDFSGDYEIVTPTEIDANGAFIGFGCVPIDQDRWNFLPGEEKSKPVNADSQSLQIPTLPTGVVVEFINNVIQINYDASLRQDWSYEFQYQHKPEVSSVPLENAWLNMQLQSNDNYAISGAVSLNSDFFLRWRGVSTGGFVSDWVVPISEINTSVLTFSGNPILNAYSSPETHILPSTPLTQGFFVNRLNGALVGNSLFEYAFWPVIEGQKYRASGQSDGASSASLVFFDEFDNYLSYQDRGGENTTVVDFEFTAPSGAAFVAMSQTISYTNELIIKNNGYTGFTISVTGGQGPYLFQDIYDNLPNGLTINPLSGVISGTPTEAGTFSNILIRVQDHVGNFKNFPEFTIEVEV